MIVLLKHKITSLKSRPTRHTRSAYLSPTPLVARTAFHRFHPDLCSHLHRVPRIAERRRVAEVEIIQIFDAHAMEQRRCEDIDAFRHPRLPVAEDLRAQKSAGSAIARHPDVQFLCVRVVDLVVPGLRSDGDGSNPAARASAPRKPVRAIAKSKTLTVVTPAEPGDGHRRLFIAMG